MSLNVVTFQYIYPAPNGKSIYGQAMGGQFGNTVQFLKDVNGDGFPGKVIIKN